MERLVLIHDLVAGIGVGRLMESASDGETRQMMRAAIPQRMVEQNPAYTLAFFFT